MSGSSPAAGKSVRVTFDGRRLTADAGVLVLAGIERRLGIAERLAHCIEDPRPPERVHHTVVDMLRFALIKVVGRVAELASRIELLLPSGYPYQRSIMLLVARAARPP